MEISNDFNRIIEMNAEAERRKFAAMAMQGIIANGELVDPEEVADYAVKVAKAVAEGLKRK